MSLHLVLCLFSDMETPFLSFSNPNYQFSEEISIGSDHLDNIDAGDINIMSQAEEKQEQSKLLNGEDLKTQSYVKGDNAFVQSVDGVSDEENDFVDENTDLLNHEDAEHDSDEKVDNTDCINHAYGEKPKGILAYISLLEQSARERSERRKRELENAANLDECDSGQTTPSVMDKLKEKTYVVEFFSLNSLV